MPEIYEKNFMGFLQIIAEFVSSRVTIVHRNGDLFIDKLGSILIVEFLLTNLDGIHEGLPFMLSEVCGDRNN